MTEGRRTFLKGSLIAGTMAALPWPFKMLSRIGLPATAVVRWGGLSFSTTAVRAGLPVIASATARLAAARAWLLAGSASLLLKRYVTTRRRPRWFNPIFRPSLTSPLTGQVR